MHPTHLVWYVLNLEAFNSYLILMKGIHSQCKMGMKAKLLYIQSLSLYYGSYSTSVRNPTPSYFYHLMAELYWHVGLISGPLVICYLFHNYWVMKKKNKQESAKDWLSVERGCFAILIFVLAVPIGGFTCSFFVTLKNEMNSLGAEGITSVTIKPGPGLSTLPLVVHFVESFAFCSKLSTWLWAPWWSFSPFPSCNYSVVNVPSRKCRRRLNQSLLLCRTAAAET